MRTVSRPLHLWSAALALAVLGAAAGLYGTQSGLFQPHRDGPVYQASAESLHRGDGYRIPFGDPGKPLDFAEPSSPVVDFPPGYPALLALVMSSGVESEMAVRLVGAALVATTGLLVAMLAIGRSLPLWATVLVTFIATALALPYALTPVAEILYVPLLVITLIAGGSYVRSGRPINWLTASIGAAVATSVRTAGLVLVGTVAIVAVLVARPHLHKWSFAAISLGLGLAPFLLFAGPGNRVLAWHPPDVESFRTMARAMARWIVPPLGTGTAWVVTAAVILVPLILWVALAAPAGAAVGGPIASRPWMPGLVSAMGHVAIVLVARMFFDAQTEPDPRQLFPVAMSLLIAGTEFSADLPRSSRAKRVTQALVVLALAAAIASTWSGVERIVNQRQGALSLNSVEFKSSPSMSWVVQSIPGHKVFSNLPDAIWVAGSSHARPLPVLFDPLSLHRNSDLEAELAKLQRQVELGAVIHYQRGHRDYMVGEAVLSEITDCVVIDDGTAVVLADSQSVWCASPD